MVPNSAGIEAVASKASQWVVFACGEHTFGLPLEHSREILTARPITRLPGCGPEVCGLVGIRGRVYTVFDLGFILTGSPSRAKPDHRMLVLALGDRRVGVVVDDIVAVSRDAAPLQPLTDEQPRPGTADPADYTGTAVVEDRTFLALDPDRILGRLLT